MKAETFIVFIVVAIVMALVFLKIIAGPLLIGIIWYNFGWKWGCVALFAFLVFFVKIDIKGK